MRTQFALNITAAIQYCHIMKSFQASEVSFLYTQHPISFLVSVAATHRSVLELSCFVSCTQGYFQWYAGFPDFLAFRTYNEVNQSRLWIPFPYLTYTCICKDMSSFRKRFNAMQSATSSWPQWVEQVPNSHLDDFNAVIPAEKLCTGLKWWLQGCRF